MKSRHALDRLDVEARRDLARLGYPPPPWTRPPAPDACEIALDVAIVGAGMTGLAIAFALAREGVPSIALFDRASAGHEGPWVTHARMETLRSPKELTGPDLGVPALTYRAWHEAAFGADDWAALGKIPRAHWMAYLVWLRRLLALPVENDRHLVDIQPRAAEFELRFADGTVRRARKVVLATGRDGSGGPRIPGWVPRDLMPDPVAHSSDPIDVARLAGRKVAVLGVGASGFDNAATALEAGAAEVHLFARRPAMPQVNKMKGLSYPGAQRGFHLADDATRWRFIFHGFSSQTPPPRESVLRVIRHAGAQVHLGCAWRDMRRIGARIEIATAKGPFTCDVAILATGFGIDLRRRAELARLVDDIATWNDRYQPPADERDAEMARFPYVDGGFAFTEKQPGRAPWLRHLHCFNYGATLNHGQLAGDIPGLAVGVGRLVDRLVADLWAMDLGRHWEAFRLNDAPELADTPFHRPRQEEREI
jgi:cation diffusion facilitator CzcD-associated flavoprotein CzcO